MADESLDPDANSHSFDPRLSGPEGETTIVVAGADTATIRDARRFMVAFESPTAVILALQTRNIWIHLEQDSNGPDSLRVRNVPAIEPGGGNRAARAGLPVCMPANLVGRARTRKRRPGGADARPGRRRGPGGTFHYGYPGRLRKWLSRARNHPG